MILKLKIINFFIFFCLDKLIHADFIDFYQGFKLNNFQKK